MTARSTDGRCDEAAFLSWARDTLVPLSTGTAQWQNLRLLGDMIGAAPIVALGEGAHFAAEPLDLRNRFFQYLVQEKGFTAIAIESGLVEGRLIHDFVQGAPGNCTDVLSKGLSWNFDRLPQNEELVRWLKNYNTGSQLDRKISFYGFDVAGSPGNPRAARSIETALVEVLRFLERVDPHMAARFSERVDPYLPSLRLDLNAPIDGPSYDKLNQLERDTLTAAIADLGAVLNHHAVQYVSASGSVDYEWALRAAKSASQVDCWLRQIPPGWRPFSEQIEFLSAAMDVRDRAQADNVDWIIRREGSEGKVLVHAHTLHLSMAPVTMTWRSHAANVSPRRCTNQMAGSYLREQYGDRLVTISQIIGAGEKSMAELCSMLGVRRFALDLRVAPAQIRGWLTNQRRIDQGSETFGMEVTCETAISRAFDILLYIDTV